MSGLDVHGRGDAPTREVSEPLPTVADMPPSEAASAEKSSSITSLGRKAEYLTTPKSSVTRFFESIILSLVGESFARKYLNIYDHSFQLSNTLSSDSVTALKVCEQAHQMLDAGHVAFEGASSDVKPDLRSQYAPTEVEDLLQHPGIWMNQTQKLQEGKIRSTGTEQIRQLLKKTESPLLMLRIAIERRSEEREIPKDTFKEIHDYLNARGVTDDSSKTYEFLSILDQAEPLAKSDPQLAAALATAKEKIGAGNKEIFNHALQEMDINAMHQLVTHPKFQLDDEATLLQAMTVAQSALEIDPDPKVKEKAKEILLALFKVEVENPSEEMGTKGIESINMLWEYALDKDDVKLIDKLLANPQTAALAPFSALWDHAINTKDIELIHKLMTHSEFKQSDLEQLKKAMSVAIDETGALSEQRVMTSMEAIVLIRQRMLIAQLDGKDVGVTTLKQARETLSNLAKNSESEAVRSMALEAFQIYNTLNP